MRSIWRTLGRDTLTGIAAVLLAVAMIGVSYGATAVSSGFPIWLPVVLGVVVLAGGAEFLFIGIIAAGGSPIAAVLAGLVVNARHLPYGLSLPDMVGTGWRRVVGVHVMNDESVAMALAESESDRKRAAYWACGLGVLLAWPGGAAIGALIGSVVPDTSALGLDAVFPAVLLALVIPALRDRDTLGAVCVGAAVAVLSAPFLPPGLPVLFALSGILVAAFTLGRGGDRTRAGTESDAVSITDSAAPVGHPDRTATESANRTRPQGDSR
ncbi:AzlC family ABC transporter permease [Nocardia sp. NPDC050710]|uniref:AzlC family ABC transporter permease n=1 Tax=Nocardia sp. NPDC050710 TaxID=3157220 RepID=UPI0033D4B6FF